MKNLLGVVAMWISLSVYAQDSGIRFRTDSLHILLAEAKQKKTLIFVDAYTSWCGPCKWMDANVFTNDTVGAYYNEHFIATRINMEKGEGIKMAKKYSVHCYPTLLFIDGNGKVVHRTSGGLDTHSFLQLGKEALDTINNFGSLEKRYTSKTINTPDFIQYIYQRSSTCLRYNIDSLTAEWEQNIPMDSLVSRDSWLLLNTIIKRKQSRLFQYLISHRSLFDVRYTPDSVDKIIERTYLNEMYQCMGESSIDTVRLQKVKDEVQQLHMPISDKIIAKGEIEMYLAYSDWKRFVPAVFPYMKKYGHIENYMSANDYAYIIYEQSTSVEHLKEALSWAKYSVFQLPNYANTDTYATLLFSLGKYAEAKVWATISITLAKEKGMDYSVTEKLLEQIQNVIKNGK